MTFAAGLTPLLVFVASFFSKKAYWHTEKSDYLLMAISVLGIILWSVTKQPNIAIIFMIIADLTAGLPTFIKSYHHPETESWPAYAISTFGFLIGVVSIQVFNFQNGSFVIYLLLNELMLTIFAMRGLKVVRESHL